MYIVAIAWIYVVFMMSITEESVVAGVMTFVLYGILPLTIILYIMGTPRRKRRKAALAAEAEAAAAEAAVAGAAESKQEATDASIATSASTAPDRRSTGAADDARNLPGSRLRVPR